MPWKHEWVDPEVAFQVVVTKPSTQTSAASVWPYDVYHVYKDDNYNERLSYWYTLHSGYDPDGTYTAQDTTHYHFDIREVPTYNEDMRHVDILDLAIRSGLCTIEDCFIHFERAHPTPETPQ